MNDQRPSFARTEEDAALSAASMLVLCMHGKQEIVQRLALEDGVSESVFDYPTPNSQLTVEEMEEAKSIAAAMTDDEKAAAHIYGTALVDDVWTAFQIHSEYSRLSIDPEDKTKDEMERSNQNAHLMIRLAMDAAKRIGLIK